jgi:gliding motility-associated-like protein
MKKSFYIFLLFFLQFLIVEKTFATHIIGGEMNYKCLGNNKYEITLTIFRDCFNGVPPFDDTAHVGIFDKNFKLIDSLLLKLNPDDTLKAILNDTCLVVPKNVCVHTTTYRTIVELKPLAGGYILAYQRCCRNKTIVNIIEPERSGATFSVVISEDALNGCNNSAKFKNWPPIFICVNEPIKFDHSAIDADKDSVFYRLCTPYLGADYIASNPTPSYFTIPFDTIKWKAPYNRLNMLGGNPLKIDPKTGELTGKPNTIGQFVVGICADEYRKGKLISTNRRDFQYNVGVCGSADAAIFAPKIQCDNLAVKFENLSQNSNKFIWDFGDTKILTDTSSLKNPTYTYADTGTYKVRLIASPGSVCSDTTFHIIRLSKSVLVADFSFTTANCKDSLDVIFQDKSTDLTGAPSGWQWKLFNGKDTIKSNLQNPTLKPWKSATWIAELTVFAKNGCPKTLRKEVIVDLIDVKILDTVRACIGENVALIATPKNYTYSWTPTSAFQNPTQGSQTAVVTADAKTYTAEISSKSCKTKKSITVLPDKSTPKLVVKATPDTITIGKTSQLEASVFPSNYKYLWSPSGTLSSEKLSNPLASPTVTTLYQLTVTPPNGACPAIAEARVVVIFPDCAEPYIFIPNAFTPNQDGVNDILFVRGPIRELYFIIFDRWGEKVFETTELNTGWDGFLGNTPLPPDVYGYYLKTTCYDGKVFVKKGNVTLMK